MDNKKNKLADVIVNIFFWIVVGAAAFVLLHFARRVFIAEKFIIPTYSMYPTLVPGDRILAGKLRYGARIYKDFDFTEHAPLKCFRTPAFGKIKPGQILVFNEVHPYGDWSKIEFQINKVYCKRVFGTPGDSISIIDGVNYNNRFPGNIGLVEAQAKLNDTPDSILIQSLAWFAYPIWQCPWTSKNMGPLYVPGKGDKIELTQWHCSLYGQIIEYETGMHVEFKDSMAYLGQTPVREYVFKDDYFYVLGDNSVDSGDSRFWGFVPGCHVIGTAKRILWCRDRRTDVFRWDRIVKKI